MLARAQALTANLLHRRATGGVKTSFQQYLRTSNVAAGSDTETATGAPVLAAMARDVETRARAGDGTSGSRPVRTKVEVFHVEIPAFSALGGLTDEWRPTVAGVERRLENVVLCDDETFYVARLSTGGA